MSGFRYWAHILEKHNFKSPAIISVETSDKGYSAYGGGWTDLVSEVGRRKNKEARGIFTHGHLEEPKAKDAHYIRFTTVHELAHGLFNPEFYHRGLYNSYLGTFGGPKAYHVNDVLEITSPGATLQHIPMNPNRKSYGHIELNQSLMSHQDYRTYDRFMEAELALLQDVGWSIDRRNFYGYSLYRDGQTLSNKTPYFARNAKGTKYIPNTYNRAPYGVGLHIYGNNNTVTQEAHILTRGTHAIGARVDGVGNTLIIAPKTKIDVKSSHGVGVFFAYGKNHSLVLDGTVKALGPKGIGLKFEFKNYLSRNPQKRGSFLYKDGNGKDVKENYWEQSASMLEELKGPLAESVVINGTLSGKKQAIYIGDTAWVKNITITPNAQVKGDIISRYKDVEGSGNPRLTSLVFGGTADKASMSPAKFTYSDNIQGDSIALFFKGPYTALYKGNHRLHSVSIAPGATLAGNSTFTLSSDKGRFINEGVLSPSRSEKSGKNAHIGQMTIDGTFEQTEAGKLIIDVSKKGKADLLHVTKKAYLGGTLEVRSEPTFYPNSWRGRIDFLKADGGIEGDFSQKIMPLSPTLVWNLEKTTHSYGVASPLKEKDSSSQPMGEEQTPENTETSTDRQIHRRAIEEPVERNHDTAEEREESKVTEEAEEQPRTVSEDLAVTRPSHAYSQYTTNVNEESVGRVLDRVVEKADAPLQDLYTALDFSAPDGSEVRSASAQLSPIAYGGVFASSLAREHQISDTLNQRPFEALTPGQWQVFALPFVSQTASKSQKLQVGTRMRSTGLIAGIEHQTPSMPGLTWGVHGVIGDKGALNFETADSARGSLQAWGVGVHLRYGPHPLSGPYVSAQARMGLEQGILTRTLAVNSYNGEQKGKWQGVTATTSILGGHLWKVHDLVSLGPVVGFDYTVLTRPEITEKGPSGLSMVLEKNRYHSLQGSLGIRGVISLSQKATIDLQARWDRELLKPTLTQKARFANISDSSFNAKTQGAPRDALNVSGQVAYEISPTVTIGARASAQFARSQKPNLIGNLSLSVKF